MMNLDLWADTHAFAPIGEPVGELVVWDLS